MGVNSLPKTLTQQRCGCDLNPGPSATRSAHFRFSILTRPFLQRIGNVSDSGTLGGPVRREIARSSSQCRQYNTEVLAEDKIVRRDGLMAGALDSRLDPSKRRGFESRVVPLSAINLGHVVHTHVPLSSSSIVRYRSRGGNALQPGR